MKQRRLAASLTILLLAATSGRSAIQGAPTAVTVVRVPNSGIQPEVVVDVHGVLHMLYFSGEAQSGDLFYVRSADSGASFSPAVRVNSQAGSVIATGTIRGGQIAVGRNGRIHVAWNGSDKALPRGPVNPKDGRAGAPMLYARSGSIGAGFEDQRNLIQRSYPLDGGGSIAADEAGNVYVVWHANALDDDADEDRRRVWIVRSHDDGASFAAEEPAWNTPTGACGCCGMRLLASRTGSLHLLYRSAGQLINRDIYALESKDHGRSFIGAKLHAWQIAACPMSSMGIAESGPRLLGTWETAGQVYYGDLRGTDGRPPIAAPRPSSSRKHSRLAINRLNQTLLAWAEGTGWARGGAIEWQLYDSAGVPTGATERRSGLPVWSTPAVIARPDGGFTIFY